ncbi:MAG: serine/threonine protein kinase [Acidobacteriaceae bacterium]|nr:serine/threonine protein kinase [Acidobacteriaceae bacterium]
MQTARQGDYNCAPVALTPGTKLGPYEIQSPLGAGGMGEVYRARDTRLGRDVALKILPESFTREGDRLHRFEREARAVAALNHPNILAIFDTCDNNGSPFLVSEFLEGETLRTVLDRGAMPQRKTINYGVQIAQGLAAAHEKGIVHRDLKPDNIFVTKDARIKILDFGLAKLAQKTNTAIAQADTVTLTSSQTADGVVMGTASYMAPEQVRGQGADPRTDIFAFGALLYEMLSGKRAFCRDTPAETMTAVLKEDPAELSDSGQPVSLALDRIVRRCIEKDPEQRFQSAKDLSFALDAFSGTAQITSAQPAHAATRSKLWMAVVAITLIGVTTVAYFVGTRNASQLARFERLTFQRGYINGARFTPDGKNVIYSAAWEGRPYEIFSMRIGDHNARSLDLKNAMVVGNSASGDMAILTNVRRIRTTNWMQVGTLARAPGNGGAPREILEGVWDADISHDGKQFAVVRKPAGPQQLEYPVGTVLFKTNGSISHPRISPDGRLVAFLEHPIFGDNRGYVALAEAKGGVRRLTGEAQAAEGLAWSPDGREIWYAATEVGDLSQERMVHGVTPGGKIRKVFNVPGDATVWDIAADGRLLFSHESIGSAQVVASPANAPERNVSVLGFGTWGSVSSDGKAIAFTESGHGIPEDYLVFFRRLDGSSAVEIGEGNTIGMTPNGRQVVALVPSQPTKLRILPTGAGETRTFDVAPVQVDRGFVSWMPGAKEFVFLGHVAEEPPRAYRVSLDGGPVHPLTNRKGAQFWNRVSPDGKLVLQAPGVEMDWGQSGIVELNSGHVRPGPLLEGDAPVEWAQDGRHIFVAHETDEGATIFRVDVITGRRDVWKEVRLADRAGILSVSRFYVTPSGNAYAYSAGRNLSALYVYSQK